MLLAFCAVFLLLVTPCQMFGKYPVMDDQVIPVRAFAWFPDTTYSSISCYNPVELKQTRVGRDFLPLIPHPGKFGLWPFATTEFDTAFAGTIFDQRRIDALVELAE